MGAAVDNKTPSEERAAIISRNFNSEVGMEGLINGYNNLKKALGIIPPEPAKNSKPSFVADPVKADAVLKSKESNEGLAGLLKAYQSLKELVTPEPTKEKNDKANPSKK